MTGSYLVGADGGRSTVRKALDIEFEGYTFPERFLVLTTPFDFASEHGVAYRAYSRPRRMGEPCSRSRATISKAAGARCLRRRRSSGFPW